MSEPKPVEPKPVERFVSFESLLRYGRAVRLRHKPSRPRGVEWWLEVQLAGEQNAHDGSNRSIVVGFTTKASAVRTGASLMRELRAFHREGVIRTDSRYNRIIEVWRSAVEQTITGANERLLAEAEEVVREMPRIEKSLWQILSGWLRGREDENENGG